MSARRQAREFALQLLFQWDYNPGEMAQTLADFWAEHECGPKEREFAEGLFRGTLEKRAEIDALIVRYAENWDLNRMGGVDRNVLRLAGYEMLYRPDVPPVVSINEAVDIAKDYSGMESGKFVNGILERICQGRKRPARTAQTAEKGEA